MTPEPTSQDTSANLRNDHASITALISRWQRHGEHQARREVIEAFMPLARRLAGRYASASEPVEDLVQVAAVGLLGAIDRFDPERGIPFAAFAVPTILGELKRHFRNTAWAAHVPRGAQETAMRVNAASQQLATRSGRPPSLGELAEHLEISVEDVLMGLHAATAHYATSLDAPTVAGESDEPQALVECLGHHDDRFGLVDAKLSLASAITRLPYAERQVLNLRFSQDMKQTEIGRQLGCSQMQVSRLLRRAAVQVRALTDPDLGPETAGDRVPAQV